MRRLSFDEYMFTIATAVAQRSVCLHRKQGAVIVHDKRILATGYNSPPAGQPHCEELGYCAKDEGKICRSESLHGESNCIAIAAREGISIKDTVMYSIYSPCMACCNLISVAGIREVMYLELYGNFPEGPEYLRSLGVDVSQFMLEIDT